MYDLVSIDAAKFSTRELNIRLNELVEDKQNIEIINPMARHNIVVGILKKCKITIHGSLGYYCASLLDGPNVFIKGNSGWALGENLMSGVIKLSKDAGASVGASMRGGEIFIGRNAGARAGISMKGGTLIVKGNTGFLTGVMMQKGKIIICGDVGDAIADSMYEGIIYVGGQISSLGNDAEIGKITTKEIDYIQKILKNYNINKNADWKKIISSKKLYNYDALEPLEKTKLGKTI